MTRRKRGEWQTFTVEGDGAFPIDMLRYDSCWPKSESLDVPAIASGRFEDGRRRIVLVTCSENAPTNDRWRSFGWQVVANDESRYMASMTTFTDEADLKSKTMDVFRNVGLIEAVRFYRAARYEGGRGADPGLKTSVDLIRDVWAKE